MNLFSSLLGLVQFMSGEGVDWYAVPYREVVYGKYGMVVSVTIYVLEEELEALCKQNLHSD